MFRIFSFVLALVWTTAAFAQQVDPVAKLDNEYRAAITAQDHFVEAVKAVIEARGAAQKRVTELETYAKACGDKPGCFVPVQPEPPKQ